MSKKLNELTAGDFEIILDAIRHESIKLAEGLDFKNREGWSREDRVRYSEWSRILNIETTLYEARDEAKIEGRW